MRITKLAVAAAGVTFGLAACSGGSAGTTAPGASASAGTSGGASTAAGGSVADSCVTGTWTSSGVSLAFDANGARGSAAGGSGLLLTVTPDGRTVADFTAMQPVTFTTTVNGAEIKGSFAYGGKASGTVRVDGTTPAPATPAGSASAGSASASPAGVVGSTGGWKPVGPVDWRDMTVTVDLLSPVHSRIVDHVKVADYATAGGDQTGGSVDLQPILKDATYECRGDSLRLGPPPGTPAAGTWLLTRG
jgi:hypothetical protein